jgi:thiosulfate sulfurtransferase
MAYERITIADAKPLFDNESLRVADIRDAMSYESSHIKGAINLSNDNLPEFMQLTPKDAPILVCCYHGNSSQGAAQFLAAQGYDTVYSLDGGFEMWKMAVPDLCEQ